MRLYSGLCVLLVLLTACTPSTVKQNNNSESSAISRIAKSDIDEVIEIHQQVVMADLKKLMVKLYKRNPNMRHDREQRSLKDSVNLVFQQPYDLHYPQWQHDKPTDIIRAALDESFAGDRVLAFIVGMRKMLMAAYDNHSEFFYLTSISEQKLYNSARNIEIAAWLLAEKRDHNDKLLILSDSLIDEQRNLSFQRLFGRMIATQDNLAIIISQKTGRLIKTVVVKAASMMFLPI